ncbi:murein hydrolase activator EnvC family protein [Paludibacterium denitrificans]|uniref:murein hydrolase activator EnvC family protein n=1 Tax=Paludibacterium denitrificans TaxID=2675226 RepID=UPI001E62B30D|nr:hypothetical protein [Paludibacterium denitrificans]
MTQMLARQYKNGQHDAMALMLNAHDPNQTSRDLTYYQHIAQSQQQLVTALVQQQRQLETLSAQLEQQVDRLDHLSSSKSREKRSLLQDKTSKLAQLGRIDGEIQHGQSKLSKLQEDEKRLTNLIAQINRKSNGVRPKPHGRPPSLRAKRRKHARRNSKPPFSPRARKTNDAASWPKMPRNKASQCRRKHAVP